MERAFLDDRGLSGTGRSWYKHLVYTAIILIHVSLMKFTILADEQSAQEGGRNFLNASIMWAV